MLGVSVGVQGDRVGDIEIRVLVFGCGIALYDILSCEGSGQSALGGMSRSAEEC